MCMCLSEISMFVCQFLPPVQMSVRPPCLCVSLSPPVRGSVFPPVGVFKPLYYPVFKLSYYPVFKPSYYPVFKPSYYPVFKPPNPLLLNILLAI